MKIQDLSIEQLQQIVDGAPEGADIYCKSDAKLGCNPYHISEIDGDCGSDLKLSDIRAELKARDVVSDVRPNFTFGDLTKTKDKQEGAAWTQ